MSSDSTDADGIEVTDTIDLNTGSDAGTLTDASSTAVNPTFEVPGNLGFVKVKSSMPFVSVWRTSRNGESITLPLRSGYTYNFTVDWGDGESDTITSPSDSEKTHTYATRGDHVVTITGTMQTIYFNFDRDRGGGNAHKIIEIRDLGDVGWTSLERAFAGCSNLTSIFGGVLSSVTSLAQAFPYVPFVTSNVQGWDTSRVTNMSRLISHRSSIRTILHAYGNPDLSRLDTKRVTNMAQMFLGNTGINPDVRNWDFSKVTEMREMFHDAVSANPNFAGKKL